MAIHTPIFNTGCLSDNLLDRHIVGDWGLVPEEDKQSNDWSVENGARILSSYLTGKKVKIWLITEHDRSVTTLLRPMEY